MKNKTLLAILSITLLLGLSHVSSADDGLASQIAGTSIQDTKRMAESAKRWAIVATVLSSAGLLGWVVYAANKSQKQ